MLLKEYMKMEVLLFWGGRGSFRSSSPFQSNTFIIQSTAVRKVLSVPPPHLGANLTNLDWATLGNLGSIGSVLL